MYIYRSMHIYIFTYMCLKANPADALPLHTVSVHRWSKNGAPPSAPASTLCAPLKRMWQSSERHSSLSRRRGADPTYIGICSG